MNLMKKSFFALLFSLLMLEPVWACADLAHENQQVRQKSDAKLKTLKKQTAIQFQYDAQKRRTRATFTDKASQKTWAVATPVMPDFPHSVITFFDEKQVKRMEITFHSKQSEKDSMVFYYPNRQKMFQEIKGKREMWAANGKLVSPQNKTEEKAVSYEIDVLVRQFAPKMLTVLNELKYKK